MNYWMNKKSVVLSICTMAAAALMAGCGTANAGSATDADQNSSGKIEISFWHSMSGNGQEVLDSIVQAYNESQDTYEVKAQNQGSYDESTGKFFNMANGDNSADIIQIGEQNLQSMIDSGMIESMSELIEKYQYDDSDLLQQAVNFYTVDGTMYAMPFNCSSPVVYYNKDVLQAAGYTELPTTFEGIKEVAEKIAQTDQTITPVGMYAYGYALDQMVTNMGGFTINNDNGRAERATEVAYQKEITTIFNWIHDLQDAGYLLNYGSDGTNTLSGFTQKEVAMFISTSANCRNIIDSSDFEVGVAVLPVPEGVEAQGVYAGGGALCAASGMDEETQKGVMDFLTFATSAEVQATWAGGTGYFPICNSAYETESMQKTYEQYPQLKVAADQLLNSKINKVTAGPLLSQLPQLRTDLQTALEAIFNGTDVQEAIDQAVTSTNSAIASANEGVQ